MPHSDDTDWEKRYQNKATGWDIGKVSPPIKAYVDQLHDKNLKILIPGGGNSYEAEYLFNRGFRQVFVVDIAETPLKNLKKRVPDFPTGHLFNSDFFAMTGRFDLILEQTFFCALPPVFRPAYIQKMSELLAQNGRLAGVLFDFPLDNQGPPYGGSKKDYRALFSKKFTIDILERAYNSIPPRQGHELFVSLRHS